MIRDDDFDCLGIEIAGERLVVWTGWGMQEVILPHAPRDVAEGARFIDPGPSAGAAEA